LSPIRFKDGCGEIGIHRVLAFELASVGQLVKRVQALLIHGVISNDAFCVRGSGTDAGG
jgi:hypothetical protein